MDRKYKLYVFKKQKENGQTDYRPLLMELEAKVMIICTWSTSSVKGFLSLAIISNFSEYLSGLGIE